MIILDRLVIKNAKNKRQITAHKYPETSGK